MPNARLVPVYDAIKELKDADLLLFRGEGTLAGAIQHSGRSPFSHAAKVSCSKERWEVCEMREFSGGRIVTLASQVTKFPGLIDVYRTNAFSLPEMSHAAAAAAGLKTGEYYDRKSADAKMREFAGAKYGYRAVLRTWLLKSPALWAARIASRWFPCLWPIAEYLTKFAPDVTNDTLEDGNPPYCSAACAIADRLGGGVDPVPHLADAFVEPGDLARSLFNKYLMTLVP